MLGLWHLLGDRCSHSRPSMCWNSHRGAYWKFHHHTPRYRRPDCHRRWVHKEFVKGTPVLTCYRNTSSAGTQAHLIKERETLSRMFQCSCCLCGGSCGGSSSEVGLGHAAPPFLLDPEVPAPGGSNSDSKPVEKVETAQQLHMAAIQTPLREVLRPLRALGP